MSTTTNDRDEQRRIRAEIQQAADDAEASPQAVMARMLGLELRGRSLNRRIDAALERRGLHLHRVRVERIAPTSEPPRAA